MSGRVIKMNLIIVFTFVTLFFLVDGQLEEDECVTSNGLFGTCVPIRECEKLRPLIKGSRADRERLKQWHCGFEKETPKVCCTDFTIKYGGANEVAAVNTLAETDTITAATSERDRAEEPIYTCFTSEARPGTCVNLFQCPELISRLNNKPVNPQDIDYVKKSRCIGPVHLSVCCEKPLTTSEEKANSNNNSKQSRRESYTDPCQTNGLPDPNSGCCGVDSSSGNKIFHGEAASIDQYPWLAIIEYNSASRGYMCGGSLISNRYVITAAHCIVTWNNLDRGAKTVRLADYDVTNDGQDCVQVEGDGQDCTNGSITFDIVKKIVHPDYNEERGTMILEKNDIALLKLNETVPYNDFIRPICLPTSDLTLSSNYRHNNTRFIISGWGAVDQYRRSSDIKLYTDVPYVDFTSCQRVYRSTLTKLPLIWEKQICAGGECNKDSCKGDSGGPLMYLNDKKYELTGIISVGAVQCGSAGIPSIHTNIYEYLPWIRSIVV